MNNLTNQFSGIVLAGGKSRRMGTDKAMLKLGNRSFLETQAQKLRDLGAGEVIISGRNSPVPFASGIPDCFPDCGPVGGLYSCFTECHYEHALILSVDMPLISLRTLQMLLEQHFSSAHDATILSANGRIQPLIAVYRTGVYPVLQERIANKELAVRAFLDKLDCQYVEFHGDEKELINCNTRDDLRLFPV